MMVVCYFCGTMLGFDDPPSTVGGVIVAGEHLCRSCQQKFRALKKAQETNLNRKRPYTGGKSIAERIRDGELKGEA